jgi:hypothetical protein
MRALLEFLRVIQKIVRTFLEILRPSENCTDFAGKSASVLEYCFPDLGNSAKVAEN